MPRPTDKHYTQGMEIGYLSAPLAGDGIASWFPAVLSDPDLFHTRRFEIVIGQSLFTPANLHLDPPDRRDRPFAGWLYGGWGLYQENDHRSLDHLQLLIGIIGPDSLARQLQDSFHGLLGQGQPAAWSFQLKSEPGFLLSYERKWRLGTPLAAGVSFEAIPEIGGSLGNVFTYGETGVLIRLGQNLQADYGPARIRPALSGTTWFDPSGIETPIGWYLFAGAQVRAVARNLFLDGNTFAASPGVEKRPMVADLSGGVSVFWADIAKVDFVITWRTEEFVGQQGPDRYGGINLSFRLP